MRALIVIAGALAITACGTNGQAGNTQNLDENLAAENIASNDVTAIDAVTGDAANMAADVNYTELDNLSGNGGVPATSRPTRRPVGTSTTSSPAENSAVPAVANSAANATE
jgi:hypothetical protein